MRRRLALLLAGFFFVLLSQAQSSKDSGILPGPNPPNGFDLERNFFDPEDTIQYTTPLRFCDGGSVVLTANSAPGGATFQWLLGAAPINGATGVSYTANASGVYAVVVMTPSDTVTYASVTVTEFPRPNVNFNFNNDATCSGTPVQFTSAVSGGTAPYTYAWDFGDGDVSPLANPVHSFTSLGCGTVTFTVKLTVTDANGCTNTIQRNVQVKQKPDVQVADADVFFPFSNCENTPTPGNSNFAITINNISPGAACIVSYSINWGDGNVQNNVSFPITHTYTQLGAFQMVVTALGSNGCSNSKTYTIANQANPAGGLGTLGATTGLCAPAQVPFVISNWQNNSPGTTYLLDFGDGTSITLNHPLNSTMTADTVYHTYTTSSCPTPTYTATLTVRNACDQTPYTAGNIQIRIKPEAQFTLPTTVCINQSICFDNTTTTGFYGNDCNSLTQYTWNFGDGSPVSNLANPCHVYTTPGTYTVTLTASNPCGTSTQTRQICVVAPITPSFTINNSTGCAPLNVTTSNTTPVTGCTPPTFNWSVSYSATNCGTSASWSFTNGTNSSSTNASFSFVNPGTYTITLGVTNACGTFTTTRQVIVKAPPTVTLPSISSSCGPLTITPTATIVNCGTNTLSYLWTFSGGVPSTSTSATPGPVSFSTPGNHTITLAVANECGTSTASRSFTINPIPGITIPPSQVYCPGETTTPINIGGSTPGTTYSWTNNNTSIGLAASGSGPVIPSFATINSGTSPVVATITVNATANGCSNTQSFTITVNPRPASPVVTSPVNYCQNNTATALTATALPAHSLIWYTGATGGSGSATAPVPSTISVGNVTYYVSQSNNSTDCESERVPIVVNVSASPVIASSSFTNPANCNTSTGFITLNGLLPNTAYQVMYVKNGSSISVSLSSNGSGVLTISGLGAGTYTNIRVVLNNCPSNSVGPFSLSDPNPPATPVATNSGPLCTGSTLNLFATNIPGATYSWSGPAGFSSAQQNPVLTNITLPQAGVYNVTATLNGCTSPAGATTVVINATPASPTVGSNSPLCSGQTLSLTATPSGSGQTFQWNGPNSFASTSQNPTINNVAVTHSGIYTVVSSTAFCQSLPANVNVVVNPTPVITASTFTAPTACNSFTGSIQLSGLTPNTSYIVHYLKNGGSVSATVMSSSTGVVLIQNLGAGLYSNITVSLGGCSSNPVGPYQLSDPTPPPAPTVSSNSPVCEGGTLNLQASSSATGSVSYSWSGPASFSSNVQNPQINNINSANSGVYTVTTTVNGCSSSSSISVVINPRPSKPLVVRPVVYCFNAVAAPLSATPSSGNSLVWYNNEQLINGSATAIVPSTSTVGSFYYYVTQVNSFNCESDTSRIPVTIYPAITGNVIGRDTTLCSGNAPNPLTGSANISGGTGAYLFQWQVSTDGGNSWSDIPSATNSSYSPGVLFVTTHYRRKIASGPCVDNISNVIIITVQGTISNVDVNADQVICAGTQPDELNGQAPSGGTGTFIYQWQVSDDNVVWVDIPSTNTQNYQPPVLTTTKYYRRKVTSGACSAFSSAVKITVNPIPQITPLNDFTFCNGTPVSSINFNTTPSNLVTIAWTNSNPLIGLNASGIGALPSFSATNASNPATTINGIINAIPTYSFDGVSCVGPATNFTITVAPAISIQPVRDTVVCTGTTMSSFIPQTNSSTTNGLSFNWQVTGDGITLVSGSGTTIPSYLTINNGTTDLVATVTITPVFVVNGVSCEGSPEQFTVTVKSATPDASGGPDVVLCASGSYQMQATASANVTGLWTQFSGSPAIITNPTSPNAGITGLQPGQTYEFIWTVTGFASCPSTRDTVKIEVTEPLINNIDNNPQTICFGQSVTITGVTPAGGNGSYQYQWEWSFDQTSWTLFAGQTNADLTISPTQTLYVRRIVTSLPCEIRSAVTLITVQPAISNNLISADHSVCINNPANLLQGSLPSGANGTFIYQWQQSTDGGTSWTNVINANSVDYSPGIMIQTVKYRRIVTSSLCSGAQSSISNIVTIIVNPDAEAVFAPTTNISCAPFNLTPAIIGLQEFPDRNLEYQWYADDSYIGSGTAFPGYTINGAGDSVTIKLVVSSIFGCLADSMSYEFFTPIEPEPSFIFTPATGCGPLTVSFTNTTPSLNLFTYQWNFGNGQTSNFPQPGDITFFPNPTYKDTTYLVTLSAVSQCTTIVVSHPVTVKSKPKALFTPGISVGCSPMTVTFNNTSLGIGNNYIWNFGDGSAPVTANIAEPISHTFYSGVQDTIMVELVAINECGSDTMRYAIVISPNQIALDYAINGNQFSGCSPHTVQFINNSSGATLFTWNFGDNNVINTTNNIDTITHTYFAPGTYNVTLHATNGCSDTTSVETIIVYPLPVADFTSGNSLICIGQSVQFNNTSSGATSYLWNFGDNTTSTNTSPAHTYNVPGLYTVTLITYSFNAPGTICTDTVTRLIQVVPSLPGDFTADALIGNCSPFTVNFANLNLPSVSAVWNFGDGQTATGDNVSHTFNSAGVYHVTLTVIVPGGCQYVTMKTITVLGPQGSWAHTTGYLCDGNAASFQVMAQNYDSIIYHFGDGTSLATTSNFVFHTYENGGVYYPWLILKNNEGCEILLPANDSIKVDKISVGFTANHINNCGNTGVTFVDTSHAFFGKSLVKWKFGDGQEGAGFNIVHTYTASGTYPVEMIVIGESGCSDTITKPIVVHVNNLPVAQIQITSEMCTKKDYTFNSQIVSTDDISIIKWILSNGATGTGNTFNFNFQQAGDYEITLIVGTVNGCFDTVSHSFHVNPTPTVVAGADLTLCLGGSAPLSVSGINVSSYQWMPLQGLSCYDCNNPVTTPSVTTPYIIAGTSDLGCTAYDTVVVTVIQPLQMTTSRSDSICIGESINLLVSGAASYSWTPATGLSSVTSSNPIATPTITTTYRVIGYDGHNCFTDTAFITVGVGQYPTVNLGPDLTLATGTLHPLTSVIQNGPIAQWHWTPSTDLSCDDCPLPIAEIKKDISYSVKVVTEYGCAATDTISIKTFCESAQVYIPNAFTPDGDGYNDKFMVRASGVAMVKSFRVFNRWGILVYESNNHPPNSPQYGWDGKVKGVAGGPDVYVYTAEVICENGSSFTYKGNVTLLK